MRLRSVSTESKICSTTGCYKEASFTKAEQIIAWRNLCRKIASAGERGDASPARRVWEMVGPDVRQIIKEISLAENDDQITPQLKCVVLQALNELLKARGFWEKECFRSVALAMREELRRFWYSIERTEMYNRLLLDTAFPDEIKRRSPMAYEGSACPVCRTPFDVAVARRISRPRLVLTDVDPPLYERVELLLCAKLTEHFRRCTGTSKAPLRLGREEWVTYRDIPDECLQARRMLGFPTYELERLARTRKTSLREFRKALKARAAALRNLRCPLCDSTCSPKPSTVWVRQFAQREDFEEVLPNVPAPSTGDPCEGEHGADEHGGV